MATRAKPLNGRSPFENALHAAVFDDRLWTAASAAIAAYCGNRGGFLISGDGHCDDENDVLFARLCLDGERRTDLERLFFGTYRPVDESQPRIRRLPDARIVHVPSLYTDRERKTSAMFNEGLPLSRTGDGLLVRLLGPPGQGLVWVVADPLDPGGWSVSQRDAVNRLLPHLRQFVRARQTLADARALASSSLDLIENRRLGIVRLDRRGRLLEANDRARALLNAADGIGDRGGYLLAAARNDDKRLQSLLAAALPRPGNGPAAGGALLLRREPPLPGLAVHVLPAADMRKLALRPPCRACRSWIGYAIRGCARRCAGTSGRRVKTAVFSPTSG